MASLQEGVAKNDEGSETHEFTRLTIVNQKVTVLGAEAENCIGEDLSFVGATRVDVEVDPNIPQYDPTTPGSPFIDITRPAEASPVRNLTGSRAVPAPVDNSVEIKIPLYESPNRTVSRSRNAAGGQRCVRQGRSDHRLRRAAVQGDRARATPASS